MKLHTGAIFGASAISIGISPTNDVGYAVIPVFLFVALIRKYGPVETFIGTLIQMATTDIIGYSMITAIDQALQGFGGFGWRDGLVVYPVLGFLLSTVIKVLHKNGL